MNVSQLLTNGINCCFQSSDDSKVIANFPQQLKQYLNQNALEK